MGLDTGAPSLLTFDAHLSGIERSAAELVRAARLSWLGARVPSCPGWTLLDLVAHQGMVHRWATAAIRDEREHMGNAESMEREGRTAADPVGWLEAGVEGLLMALRQAPADLEAMVFLKQAPPPRHFWARRQCHETTVHALDAVAAVHQALPTSAHTWFAAEQAADGIDELLIGFWQRRRSKVRSTRPYAVHIAAEDVLLSWRIAVGPDAARTHRIEPGTAVDADAVVSGRAVDLFLALWNRGGTVTDPQGIVRRLAGDGRVTWA